MKPGWPARPLITRRQGFSQRQQGETLTCVCEQRTDCLTVGRKEDEAAGEEQMTDSEKRSTFPERRRKKEKVQEERKKK